MDRRLPGYTCVCDVMYTKWNGVAVVSLKHKKLVDINMRLGLRWMMLTMSGFPTRISNDGNFVDASKEHADGRILLIRFLFHSI